MSTPQSIPRATPRIRIGRGTVLTVLGVLAAIAATIVILALTGANHTTVTNPVAAPQVAGASRPQTHYLGPRQQDAAPNPQTRDDTGPVAGASNPTAHYACLGAAQRCLR
jgi:hypothetical protein